MNPYNKDAICVKCGSDDISSNFRFKLNWCLCDCPANTEEHICRYCRNCNYRWPEAPLDKAEYILPAEVKVGDTFTVKGIWKIKQNPKQVIPIPPECDKE